MSELKAFDITVAEEYYLKGIVKYRRSVYDKSEADRVIAHQKYRRCLAMARWCEAEAHRSLTEQSALIDFPEIDRFKYLQWHFDHFSRWHRRWMELAEKFKEEQ